MVHKFTKQTSTKSSHELVKSLLIITTTTSTALTLHHLWRKQKYPHAKISDYLIGLNNHTTDQLKRITEANKSWWQTYKRYAQTKTTSSDPVYLLQIPQTTHQEQNITVEWVSGVADMKQAEHQQFSIVGINKERNILWQTAVPERVHDIVVQPLPISDRELDNRELDQKNPHVAVMGRRPSEKFWILDSATGKILHNIQAEKDRHFYGHACYSLDGTLLYVTENNTDTFAGIIGVYDARQSYTKKHELASHGIGPHEIIVHPDGDKLVIANGGIKTERASRDELNLESMKPSLVYLSLDDSSHDANSHDAKSDSANTYGQVLQQLYPSHNQMSIRHLSAVTAGKHQGTIAIGIQFQGEKYLDIPLVLTHKFGDDDLIEYSTPKLEDWKQFYHYIASIKVNANSNLLCVTSPIGGFASIFDMDSQKIIDSIKIADCAGISVVQTHNQHGFLVSDGQGGLTIINLDTTHVDGAKIISNTMTQTMSFDNHMQSTILYQ